MKKMDWLFSLDDLMDTRMSTMLSINVAKATSTIVAGYGRRRGDWVIWEGLGITEEQWNKAYKTRHHEILQRSVRSKIITYLAESIREHITNPHHADNRIPLAFTINEYPYRLTPRVKSEFEKMIKLLTLPSLAIKWIRRSPKQLIPSYVSDNHTHFINYELISWLEMHFEEQGSGNLLGLQMIGPSLFSNKPEDQDFADFKGVLDGIHELGEYFVSPSLNIKFISAEYFNAPY